MPCAPAAAANLTPNVANDFTVGNSSRKPLNS